MKKRLSKQDILTVPNALSAFRILLIPVIVWLYVFAEHRYLAVGAVLLSAVTDVADGFIARRFNMISEVGKLLDPVADKLTQAALLICLASHRPIIYWVFALLCLKELVQGVLGLAVVRVTGKMQSARWYGKVSTVVFYVTMLVLILPIGLPEFWADTLVLLCAAALMLSMLLYVRSFLGIVWAALFPESGRRSMWLRLFMLLMWGCVLLFAWAHRDRVVLDNGLRVVPRSLVLALLFVAGLFVLKSLSVVIHSGVIYALSGILFPLPLAVAVNLLGTGLMASLSYGLGKRLGGDGIRRFVRTHRNAAVLGRLRRENSFVFTFLTRLINLLPFDIVSAFLGATGTPVGPYLLGSVAGMAASCVLFPLLGAGLSAPASPRFLIPLGLEAVLLLGSALALLGIRNRDGDAPAADDAR